MRKPLGLKKKANSSKDQGEEVKKGYKHNLDAKLKQLRSLRFKNSRIVLELTKRIKADTAALLELEKTMEEEKLKILEARDDEFVSGVEMSFQLHGGSLEEQGYDDYPEVPGFEDILGTVDELIAHCEEMKDESAELPYESYIEK